MCPLGLYGNIITQACGANPVVTSLTPLDGTVFSYGTYIDLEATFKVLNNEERSTYWYGWIISKLGSKMNLASDAAKTYANTDVTRVKLDMNIINPNNYYNITFYVQGNDTFYNGMLGYIFNVIYIGIPPKEGLCLADPMSRGVAGVTTFTMSTGQWIDPDGIQEYRFLYSLDGADTYLPIESESLSKSTVKFIFPPIYQPQVTITLQCNVKNLKGLSASRYVTFPLLMKSTVSAGAVLDNIAKVPITTEEISLQTVHQAIQIATNVGSLKPKDESYFAPKIQASECTQAMCSFNGECIFDSFRNQYFCKCAENWIGRNCSF